MDLREGKGIGGGGREWDEEGKGRREDRRGRRGEKEGREGKEKEKKGEDIAAVLGAVGRLL